MSILSLPFLFAMPGPLEMVVILLVILLLFGARKLPEISKSIGQSIKEFKKAITGVEKDTEEKNK